MAKIHTHYDNLKVARMAPQEVIRAAYKALSQKYHPDKNPGDEKAARIMAIVNTAYTALNDPVRRKEHDEWIAAEEWEVAWLESTHQEDVKPLESTRAPAGRTRGARLLRRYLALLAAAGVGAAVALGMSEPGRVLPALGLAPQVKSAAAPLPAVARALDDNWAVARAYLPDNGVDEAPKISVLATTGLVIAARVPDCANVLQTLSAPNGEPWPERSGYVAGYPLANPGKQMQVFIDNSANSSPVFIKLYDLDRNANVRHVYVQAGDTWNVGELAAGKYEVRSQDVVVGASRSACGEGHPAQPVPAPENAPRVKEMVQSGT
jgi:hypothetical protein